VKLLRPFGFYDAGVHHHWNAGQVVSGSADIATLTARGAPITADTGTDA
jgi:hypothetical protein